MKLQPRGSMVQVRRIPWEDRKTEGGLVIPAHLERIFFRAVVVARGPGQYMMDGKLAGLEDMYPGAIVLVQDNQKDPNGVVRHPHLIPVTPEEDEYLVPEHLVFAIEKPDPDADGTAITKPLESCEACEGCGDVEPLEPGR